MLALSTCIAAQTGGKSLQRHLNHPAAAARPAATTLHNGCFMQDYIFDCFDTCINGTMRASAEYTCSCLSPTCRAAPPALCIAISARYCQCLQAERAAAASPLFFTGTPPMPPAAQAFRLSHAWTPIMRIDNEKYTNTTYKTAAFPTLTRTWCLKLLCTCCTTGLPCTTRIACPRRFHACRINGLAPRLHNT